jgi:hypothetical protein
VPAMHRDQQYLTQALAAFVASLPKDGVHRID